MLVKFTPEQEAFRQEVQTFFRTEWGRPPSVSEFSEEHEQAAKVFVKKLAARGWLTMFWPKEYGGIGADHLRQLIFHEEAVISGAPSGTGGAVLVGPAIIRHGSEEQKRRFLPGIVSGEVNWVQGYSEPGAGSDLASLQTRAVRDGDDYVINGQKIWTSFGHRGDWIHVLARTDPDAPKHRGISYLLVDMKTPGVSVRRITQITGESEFCETFFENVRVPRANLLGEENRGWYLAASVLDVERSGIDRVVRGERTFNETVAFAHEMRRDGQPLIAIPGVRTALADLKIGIDVGRLLCYRVAFMQHQGLIPNYEASMSKAFGSELCQRIANVGAHLMGLYGQLDRGSKRAPRSGFVAYEYLRTVSDTIMGGTSEIQRNIIATRGLGLPRS
jgi:alkylation response protein AidB-like acyl-CoA dehydrogenase